MFRLFEKINSNQVYIIAEMSANHGGSLNRALEIVRQAAEAGADCVKIQTYTADTITINCNNEYFQIYEGLWAGYKLYDLYQNAGTPWEWQEKIKDECTHCGIDFLSTPFDSTAVDFLENIGVEAFKIASFELIDIPLIRYTASKGKTMLISCGMGTLSEIQDAIDACHQAGNNKIVLLKCCSEYPSNWEDMHISTISDMIERFHVPVGLSDHSAGSIASVVAVGNGAQVIEKHIKLPGVESADSEFSMNISDFSEMVKDVRNAAVIKGNVYYGPSPGERDSLKFRRSLFAVKDIKAGDTITKDNVKSIRPSQGMAPKYYEAILGKTAKRDISYGEPITSNAIKEK